MIIAGVWFKTERLEIMYNTNTNIIYTSKFCLSSRSRFLYLIGTIITCMHRSRHKRLDSNCLQTVGTGHAHTRPPATPATSPSFARPVQSKLLGCGVPPHRPSHARSLRRHPQPCSPQPQHRVGPLRHISQQPSVSLLQPRLAAANTPPTAGFVTEPHHIHQPIQVPKAPTVTRIRILHAHPTRACYTCNR